MCKLAPTVKAIFKSEERSQDLWFSMVRTLELFSHVCCHYRMACTADYTSKISLNDTTRQLVFHHYRRVHFCNEKLVYRGWMVNTPSYPSKESGTPLPHLSPTTSICHLSHNLTLLPSTQCFRSRTWRGHFHGPSPHDAELVRHPATRT